MAILPIAFLSLLSTALANPFSLTLTERLRLNSSPGQTKHFVSDAALSSSADTAYTLQLKVGNQELPVMLDTGSSDLWVLSTNCSSLDCTGLGKYSPSTSSSYQTSPDNAPFGLHYLIGSVSGYVASETISLGPYQLLRQTLALVNDTSGLGLYNSNTSGILGLSFPLAATITSGPSVLETLFTYLPESQRFFAVKLGRRSSTSTLSNSSFTIGQLDSDITSDMSTFQHIPVSRAGADDYNYWKVPLRSLIVNSTKVLLAPSLVPGSDDPVAVLDTGTTLILGPQSAVDALWVSVGKIDEVVRKNNNTGRWEVRCERAIEVSITLGEYGYEKSYALDPADVNWKQMEGDSKWCLGGIQANDRVESGDWLLGAVFLRNVYAIHYGANSTHPPQIGLQSTTNPSEALFKFRIERSNDDLAPATLVAASLGTAPHLPKPWLVYVLTCFASFLVGVVLMAGFTALAESWTQPRRGGSKH